MTSQRGPSIKDGGIRLASRRGGKNVESPTYIESETKRETVVKINGINIENKFCTKICPNGIMNIM